MKRVTERQTIVGFSSTKRLEINEIADARAGMPAGFVFDVAVVGLGFVGLPTALAFNASGRSVLGLDVSEERLTAVARGEADLLRSDQERLTLALEDPSFVLTSDTSLLSHAAAVLICVPTPVDSYLVPDVETLRRACASVVDNAVTGQLLILTSTTYVGATRELLAAPLARRGWTAGVDGYIAFSPERINPGVDAVEHEDVPRLVGGMTAACGAAAAEVLRLDTRGVQVVASPDAAESTKLVGDARKDLARALTQLLKATGLSAPLMLMPTEGGMAPVSSAWAVDDILLESAGPTEVEARIRLCVARPVPTLEDASTEIRAAGVVIDGANHTARVNGAPLNLTFKEFELLKYLAQHPGRVFTRQQLLTEVWGYDYYGVSRTVDVHVRRLRAKLGVDHESLISTVRSVGYRLTPVRQPEEELADA
jgi:DNA-binding winged helix-turn-helix (wHTH) protein